MLLFVGLGNPGKEYAGNRHNIGFMAIEAMARCWNFSPFRKKHQGLVSEGTIGETKVALLMPQTFMNESGRSVSEAARFHKITTGDIYVFHDELDLPASKLRVKMGGGNAGHNGLKSISAHVGNDYRRIRLGIGHPGDKARVYGYVLSDFAKSEAGWVDTLIDAVARHADYLAQGQAPAFQNRVHLAMDAAGFGDEKKDEKKETQEKQNKKDKGANEA